MEEETERDYIYIPAVVITSIYTEIIRTTQLFSKSLHTPAHYSSLPPATYRRECRGMELELEEGYPNSIHPLPLLPPYSSRPIPSPRDGPKCSHKMYHEIPRWVIYPLPARACERATIAFQPSSPPPARLRVLFPPSCLSRHKVADFTAR